MSSRRRSYIASYLARRSVAWLLVAAAPTAAKAQTFVQLPSLGEGLGARLTSDVTRSQVNRFMFMATSGKVTYIDLSAVYQFTADPVWNRLVIWKKDNWTHEFTNESGPGGGLGAPAGVDISARRRLYIADLGRSRVLWGTFDPAAGNIVGVSEHQWRLTPWPWSPSLFRRPIDVAWDGQNNPLTTDYLYVLDQEEGKVSYWNADGSPGTSPVWSFGSRGSGQGQFLDPTGICVGKTPASSGGTQFTTSFYVVDNGNRRVVWLSRTPTGATWNTVVSLGDWDPVGCTVDHFGQVYITDRSKHRIHKFNHVLWLLDSYGTYGTGTALNTFAWPQAIRVPCGLKVINSITAWYCEGRVVTAERWSDASGAVEHYLGVHGTYTTAPNAPPKTGNATISYGTTEVAYTTIDVHKSGVGIVRTLASHELRGAGGGFGVYWDGRMSDGSRAWDGTYSFRVILESPYSCPSGGTWCFRSMLSPWFYFDNCDPSAGGGGPIPAPALGAPLPPVARATAIGATEPCSGSGAPAPSVRDFAAEPVVPTVAFLRQRVLSGGAPLGPTRVTVAEPAAGQVGGPGAISALVRERGLTGLTFGVTRALAGQAVLVRLYALSGRLVRTLANETFEAGIYEVGWDGRDEHGREAAPGVYVAVMSVGPFRANQHLILRRP